MLQCIFILFNPIIYHVTVIRTLLVNYWLPYGIASTLVEQKTSGSEKNVDSHDRGIYYLLNQVFVGRNS